MQVNPDNSRAMSALTCNYLMKPLKIYYLKNGVHGFTLNNGSKLSRNLQVVVSFKRRSLHGSTSEELTLNSEVISSAKCQENSNFLEWKHFDRKLRTVPQEQKSRDFGGIRSLWVSLLSKSQK